MKLSFILLTTILITGCGTGLCPIRNSSGVCTSGMGAGGSLWVSPSGSIDTSFNGTGFRITSISGTDYGYAVAVQSDGKILVSGTTSFAGDNNFSTVRYTTTGVLDSTFNGTGLMNTDFGGASSDTVYGIALQADGKIILAGVSDNPGNYQFGIARYHSNGSADTTFNTTGRISNVFVGSTYAEGHSVVLQPDGKIVTGGFSYHGGLGRFAVSRNQTDGALDTTFNAVGYTTTIINGGDDLGYSVALQADGKIVLAGYTTSGSPAFGVVRYHSNGSVDTTFNSGGSVTTSIGPGADIGRAVAIQSDGKIVVGGYAAIGGNDDFAVVRYNTDGSLDTNFNTSGIVTTNIGGPDQANAIAIQPDGKILLGGTTVNANGDYTVVRYHSNGSLDTTFNGTGIFVTTIGVDDDEIYGMGLQSDGKIVVGGYSFVGANYDFSVLRIR